MALIIVNDYVQQCYSNADGNVIRNQIIQKYNRGEKVIVSFEGYQSVSSSFVNSAFISLLDNYDFPFIRENLTFINSTKQINDMIKKAFHFEVHDRKKLIEV